MDDVTSLTEVVRRVIATRVRQPQLVDDLTQETMLHLATSTRVLDPHESQAYAIVTARNLVTDHARREAARGRHLHRLVDPPSAVGPEQSALDREETVALARALERLSADDRELLVRHEVEGDSLELLARQADATPRAIANRLARARAALRVEFTLAHRHINLPTNSCRPVLLALSTGDRRRQQQLGARRHLQHCGACAELAGPITQRRHHIGAWLLVPLGDAGRRVARSLRSNRGTQAAALGLAAAAAVAAFAVSRSDPASAPATAPHPPPTAAAPSATAAPPGAAGATAPPLTGVPVPSPTCPAPRPLDQTPTPPPIGCPIAPTAFTATDVPADEGFWAADGTGGAVWIQLTGDGESPVRISAGSTLTASGTLGDPDEVPGVADDRRTLARGFVLVVRYEDIIAG